MKSPSKTAQLLFAALLFVNAAGALFLKNHLELPTDTAHFYSPVAQNLLAGKGYLHEENFSDRYPPGYPLFLAAVYALPGRADTENQAYPFMIAFLQAASCVFLYKIAKHLTTSRKAVAAAVLFSFYPFFAVLSVTRYAWTAMPVFIFFFYAGLYWFLKSLVEKTSARGFFVSGVLLGCSALVWPASLYIWPLFVFYLLLKPQTRQGVFSFIPGFFLPILIWSSVVWAHTGNFRVSGGEWLSVKDGLVHQSGSAMKKFVLTAEIKEEIRADRISSPSEAAHFVSLKLKENFKDTAGYLLFKFFRPWYATDSEKFEKTILAVQLPYVILTLSGAAVLLNENKKRAWLVAALVLYFWLASFFVLSILRYMVPAMGLLMIFVPAGAEAIFKRISGK